MPEPEEHASDLWFTRHRFLLAGGWVMFCFILAFGFNTWPPIMTLLAGPVVVLILTSPSLYKEWKYDTLTVIVADNKHFSFNTDDLFRVGRWVIMRGGGVNSNMFSLKGREGTIVVPEELVHDNGHAIVIRANLGVVEYGELLPEIRRLIDTHNLPKPYFWSIVPTFAVSSTTENDKKLQELMDLQPKYQDVCNRVTELQSMVSGRFKDIRKLVRHLQGIMGESWREKLKKIISKPPEGDSA